MDTVWNILAFLFRKTISSSMKSLAVYLTFTGFRLWLDVDIDKLVAIHTTSKCHSVLKFCEFFATETWALNEFIALTSVEFFTLGIDVFHVENIFEQNSSHVVWKMPRRTMWKLCVAF